MQAIIFILVYSKCCLGVKKYFLWGGEELAGPTLIHACFSRCFQWVKNTCYFRSEICNMFLCKCFNVVIVVVSHLIRSLFFFYCASLSRCIFYILHRTYGAIMRNFGQFRRGMRLGELAQFSVPLPKQILLNLSGPLQRECFSPN